MTVIYKYPVERGIHILSLPIGATILHFDAQYSSYNIWAIIDTDVDSEDVEIQILGTGRKVDEGLTYINTIIDGAFVWHAFYRKLNSDYDQEVKMYYNKKINMYNDLTHHAENRPLDAGEEL